MRVLIITALMFFGLQSGAQIDFKWERVDSFPSGTIPYGWHMYMSPEGDLYTGSRGDDGWMIWKFVAKAEVGPSCEHGHTCAAGHVGISIGGISQDSLTYKGIGINKARITNRPGKHGDWYVTDQGEAIFPDGNTWIQSRIHRAKIIQQ